MIDGSTLDVLFKGFEIISILGGGGMVAYRLGKNSQAVRTGMEQQATELTLLRTDVKELSKLVTEVAVQNKRIDMLEQRYEELRHGEGFVFPLSAQLHSAVKGKP